MIRQGGLGGWGVRLAASPATGEIFLYGQKIFPLTLRTFRRILSPKYNGGKFMADITICQRNDYSGLDADKPASANLADTYNASDTGKKYYWNGSAWVTGLGTEYVARVTNGVDKQVGDFTTDASWKNDGLDLSGIIPSGAVAVHLLITIEDELVGSKFRIRKDVASSSNRYYGVTYLADKGIDSHVIIALDSNRLLDYFGDNVGFVTIDVTVLGWFI